VRLLLRRRPRRRPALLARRAMASSLRRCRMQLRLLRMRRHTHLWWSRRCRRRRQWCARRRLWPPLWARISGSETKGSSRPAIADSASDPSVFVDQQFDLSRFHLTPSICPDSFPAFTALPSGAKRPAPQLQPHSTHATAPPPPAPPPPLSPRRPHALLPDSQTQLLAHHPVRAAV
jgi:hypothetical protein